MCKERIRKDVQGKDQKECARKGSERLCKERIRNDFLHYKDILVDEGRRVQLADRPRRDLKAAHDEHKQQTLNLEPTYLRFHGASV
jgi:hypothetical protein